MSIFDLGFDDAETFVKDAEAMMPLVDDLISDLGLANNQAVTLVRDGVSPHIAVGLDSEHLDAIFVSGLNLMQAGEAGQARAVFTKLVALKGTDCRFWYALGASLQIEGRYEDAARAYVVSLGLNAVDVDGYLRLGECALAAQELPEALECFKMAFALCENGYGQDAQAVLTEQLILHTNERLVAIGASEKQFALKGNGNG